MKFTFRVYYEDDSIYNFGRLKSKLVKAKNKEHAAQLFKKKYGIEPSFVV